MDWFRRTISSIRNRYPSAGTEAAARQGSAYSGQGRCAATTDDFDGEDRAVKPDSWDSISGGAEARGSNRAGVGFFGAVGLRSKREQPVAAHRSRKVATAYPITDWIGCRAGIPHDFSLSACDGCDLGSETG